jgi:hypothetical protein
MSWWRVVSIVLLAVHGVGHLFFLVPTLGVAQWGFAGRSWLLTGHVPDTVVKVAGGVLWLLVIAGFVAAAIGLWGQQEWWRGVAVGSAAVSLLGLALFAQATQPFLSAGLMDIAILVALVLFHWPTADMVGA